MLKPFFLSLPFLMFICFTTVSFAQLDHDTLRIPLLKKTTKRGWLINVMKPVFNSTLDSGITGYPEEIIERRYIKVRTNIYQSNLKKIQERDIIILVGMDKSRTKKYIIADIDMDGRLSDEIVYTFDKSNMGTYAYWESNAPIFSFPYAVTDDYQPVQKYSTYRIIPWNLYDHKEILTKSLFEVVLNPIDHYESETPYDSESLLVSDQGDLGYNSKTFSVLTGDVISSYSTKLWKYSGDIIKYQLTNYKIISLEKGRIDYLVLTKATTDDLNESLKPFYSGNSPEDITFTTSNEILPKTLHGYRGKYLLLEFWGTWCGPCRKITPDLVDLHQSINTTKITMLGVNCEFTSGSSDPQIYIKNSKIEWPQIFEKLEKGNIGLLNAAKVSTFPTLILIDEEGVVQARVSEPKDIQQLIEDIKKVFK